MGITFVQKSDLSKKKLHAKTALVLAGGAVSGGAFKAGGLKALNDFLVNKKVTDFDIYVGISAGGFLSVPLAGGIPPEEILKSLDGTSERWGHLRRQVLQAPPCAVEGHPLAQLAERQQEIAAATGRIGDLPDRNPQVVTPDFGEACRRHADNRERDAIQPVACAETTGVAVKPALPERIPEDHHRISPGNHVLVGPEEAADVRRQAEHGEVVRGHHVGVHFLGALGVRDRDS